MGSSARNGPRVSARRTRRTLPVLPGGSPADDHATPTAAEPAPPAETMVAAADTAEVSAVVPRGLQVAAAWSWRVILVVVLLWGIAWLVRYLSEVFIPVAVAILLTALMLPVANALRKGRWGLPRAAATADYGDRRGRGDRRRSDRDRRTDCWAGCGTLNQRGERLQPVELLAEQWPTD